MWIKKTNAGNSQVSLQRDGLAERSKRFTARVQKVHRRLQETRIQRLKCSK